MSFALETEKLTQDSIQAEYLNAVVNFGEKYHSLHEGYAVLLEEVEEVKQQFETLFNTGVPILWESVKTNDFDCAKLQLPAMLDNTIHTILELAQVGAVLMKMQNTLDEVK